MKKILLALLLCLALLPLCGCADKGPQRLTAYSFDYFDTVTTVIGYEADKAAFDAVTADIFAALEHYHRLYNIYLTYDGLANLATVNSAEGKPVTVDAAIVDMLAFAAEMHTRTDGRVNVAMGSVLSVWHDYREVGKTDPASAALPPFAALEEAAFHTDISSLLLDKVSATVQISDPAVRLDVGAVAKGYAVEQVAKMLEVRGISGYLLNVGGNVRAVGLRPDGSSWIAGVENPLDADGSQPYLVTVALSEESLVTSGCYQRFYYVDGKRYHHIIDPDTLMPAEYFTAVSVIAPDSGVADALSTALFTLSYEEGLALLERFPGVGVLWLYGDGAVKMNEAFEGYIVE